MVSISAPLILILAMATNTTCPRDSYSVEGGSPALGSNLRKKFYSGTAQTFAQWEISMSGWGARPQIIETSAIMIEQKTFLGMY